MNEEMIGLGIVGCGDFGQFALQHIEQVSGVQFAGMAGSQNEAAQAVAKRFEIPDIQEVNARVQRSDIDLIHITTQPFLHPRRITQENGHATLVLAIEAARMADAAEANP